VHLFGRPIAEDVKPRQRLDARGAMSPAAVVVGHAIFFTADDRLRDGAESHDLGRRPLDSRDRGAVERRLIFRLEDLGAKAALEPPAWKPV
jgi:hypothetical protein